MARPSTPRRWRKAPARLTLSGSDVHVWRARLDVDTATLACLSRSISPDERARAERFRRPADRRAFVAARGVLRRILARYVGVSPCALSFAYGPFGKPELSRAGGSRPLAFNLSHSGDRAIYAIAASMDVGVDIEQVRPFADFERLARRRFSAADVQALDDLPPDRRQSMFFVYWVRQEASVKATGEGLHGLGSRRADRLTIVDLAPFRGFVAAFAVHGLPARVRCWSA